MPKNSFDNIYDLILASIVAPVTLQYAEYSPSYNMTTVPSTNESYAVVVNENEVCKTIKILIIVVIYNPDIPDNTV